MPGARDPRATAFRLLGEPRYEWARALWLAFKIRTGRFSNPEVALIEELVRPGETVVDVGANYGMYAFHLARRVGADGRVVAFEAAPGTALALRRVLRALQVADWVEVREQAAGESAGTLRLVTPRRADGSTQSGLAWGLRSDEPTSAESVSVPLVRLDDALEGVAEVAFLKVDVEGADLRVLRGASALLRRDAPTILLEVSPPLLARQGLTRAEVAAFLAEHGYATHRLTAGRLHPQPVATADGDVLAVHPRRAERVRGRLAP